jgi:ADP-heptose:LPS heptosyltransferase
MKIGIIRTSSIGDVVLATAALELLQQVDRAIEIIWVGREPSLGLIAAGRPQVHAKELASGASREVSEQIIGVLKTCDLVIDLQTSFRTRQITRELRRAKVPVVAADKQLWRRFMLVAAARLRGRFFPLKRANIVARDQQFEMMREAMFRGLALLGLSPKASSQVAVPRLIREVFTTTEEAWHRELSFGSWIAVAPGASHGTKKAPIEVMSQVIKHMASHNAIGDFGLVFVGGADDRAAAVEFLDTAPWQGPVMNLAGKLTLVQTTSVLANVRGLLSNDSGLAHIAEAIGTPVAVLFGPTIEAFGFSPRDPRSRAFSSEIGCRPCSKHGKTACRYGDKLCFLSIDTSAVAEHVGGFLAHQQGGQA